MKISPFIPILLEKKKYECDHGVVGKGVAGV
jgi:hypothetical protein